MKNTNTNANLQNEIEHIRNVSDVSLDEAIDIHYDFIQATNSIFG